VLKTYVRKILKTYMGTETRFITKAFKNTKFKIAFATENTIKSLLTTRESQHKNKYDKSRAHSILITSLQQFGIPKCTKIKGTCSYERHDDDTRGPKHVASEYFVKDMYISYDNVLLFASRRIHIDSILENMYRYTKFRKRIVEQYLRHFVYGYCSNI
jgi:hypothetical protein